MPYQPDYAESPAIFTGKDAARLGWSLVKSTRADGIAQILENVRKAKDNTCNEGGAVESPPIVTVLPAPSIPSPSPVASLPVASPYVRVTSSGLTSEKVRAFRAKFFQENAASIEWHRKLLERVPPKPRLIDLPIPSRPWKRLLPLDKLKNHYEVMKRSGPIADATLHVDRVLQAKAMKSPRGPVDYFKRRLRRVLTKLLNRPVSFFIGCEITKGKFHIHGIFDLAPQEFAVAEVAFGKALGKWTGRSAKHKFLLRPDPDKYWIDYILKDGSQQEWNPLALTDNLLKASIAAHDAGSQPDSLIGTKIEHILGG